MARMSLVATVLQPPYLGWLGFYEMIARADVYVAYDTVQFEPRSWQQRNRVKGSNGEIMLTVPMKTAGRRFQRIADVEIDNSTPWQKKHRRTISGAYRKAPHADYLNLFEAVYQFPKCRLVDLNLTIIRLLMDCLQLDTPIVRASELGPLPTGREENIIGILKAAGANVLYDAAGAEAILDPRPFEDAGIELRFQKYHHPTYPQLHGAFLPYMSALDLLLNVGPDAKRIILSGASREGEE